MDEVTNSNSRPAEISKTPKDSVSGEYCIDYDDDYIKSEQRKKVQSKPGSSAQSQYNQSSNNQQYYSTK